MGTLIGNTEWVRRIVNLLNKNTRLSGLCKELACDNAQTLYRTIRKLLVKGILSKHMIVPLESLPMIVSVAVLVKRQKTRKQCIMRGLYPVIHYYSHTGNPVEIHYTAGECSKIEDLIDTSTCELHFCERLIKTIVPIEKPDGIELSTGPCPMSSSRDSAIVDDVDIDMALDIFRLNNPPFKNSWKVRELLKMLEQRLGIRNARYHYYAHLRKELSLHYTVKGYGDFLVLMFNASTLRELERALNTLLRAGFIAGTWQVHCFGKAPLTALVYSWGYINKFVEPEYIHEDIDGISYIVLPVLGVYHGVSRT